VSIIIERIDKILPTFTICTMITDNVHYGLLRRSLTESGFDHASEYFAVDNRNEAEVYPFSFIRQCIEASNAPYIVICHQDVRFNKDNFQQLLARLLELDQIDRDWACCGNAGVSILGKYSVRISDPHGADTKLGDFPCKVRSLDENFIVLNKSNLPTLPNVDYGFHYYGTVLSVLATAMMKTVYSIDFHVTHLSPGGINSQFYDESILWSRWLYKRRLRICAISPACGALIANNMLFLQLYRLFCSLPFGKVPFRNAIHKYLSRQ
jgi:hypothetical protein